MREHANATAVSNLEANRLQALAVEAWGSMINLDLAGKYADADRAR